MTDGLLGRCPGSIQPRHAQAQFAPNPKVSIAEISSKADQIVADMKPLVTELVSAGDKAAAKRAVVDAQPELRMLKRDAADEERGLKEQFQDERLKISNSGQTIGMFAGAKARGAMARSRAASKRELQARQAAVLRPSADLKSDIDRRVLAMDRVKATLV